MGLLKNIVTLEKIQEYLSHTNFGNQSLGHNLALSFMPSSLGPTLVDKRYTFELRHNLFAESKKFDKVTYGEIIVGTVLELTKEIKTTLSEEIKTMYTEVGLIEEDRCTKELVATVLANAVALRPSFKIGNTSTSLKFTDNLQNLFKEFGPKNIEYFLEKLDNYKPTI